MTNPDLRMAVTADATSPTRLNRGRVSVLALFGTVMLVGGTDMTKVAVALPEVNEALSLGTVQSLWIADAYALAAGSVLVSSAVVADRYGRKRLYLLGLGVAIASAVLAGAAQNGGVLIAARVGQGVGSALLIAGTVAIIRVTFPGVRLRALAYGVWASGFSAGSALGPLLGGGLVDLTQWQWVFWINAPILLGCLFAAYTILPESTNPDPPSLDGLSAGLSAASVGLLIAGLKGLTQPTTPQWLTLAALGVGAVAAVVFVIRQLRLPRPFLDVRLFTNRLLAVSAAVIAATLGVLNGVLYLLTLRYQVIDGLSAAGAGLALIPMAAAMAVGGLAGPLLQQRFVQQHVIVGGLVLVAGGSLVLSATLGAGQLAGMIPLGLGSGLVMATGANAVMSAAPSHRTADAGAIQESAFALGAGVGIAVLGVLAMHVGASTGTTSTDVVHGHGTEVTLKVTAYGYTFFALAASIVILRTTRSPTLVECHR